MYTANVQRIARQFGGGTGQFNEDLHKMADRVGVPTGQLVERLGQMFGVNPDVVLANLDGFVEVLGVLTAPGIAAHVYAPGVNGTFIRGLQPGNYTSNDGSTGYSAVDGTAGLVLDAAGQWSSVNLPSGSWTAESGAVGLITVNSATSVSFNAAGVGDVYSTAFSGPSLGDWCEITFTVSGLTSGSVGPVVGYGAARNLFSANGTYTQGYVVGGNAALYVYCSAGTTATVTINSIRKYTGIHASQSSGAARPGVRRGLYNLQPYSNDVTNVGYSVTNTSRAAGTLARTSTAASCYTGSPAFASPIAVGQKFTTFAKVKAKSLGNCFALRPTGTYPDRCDAVFNLATGAVVGATASGGFSGAAGSIAGPDGNGFYIVAVNGTVGTTAMVNNVIGPCDTSATVTVWEGISATLSDCYIEALGTVIGTLTASQILSEGGIPLTTSAAASNQSAGRYSFDCGAGTKSMMYGSVPFQMTDDHCVVVAARCDSSAFNNHVINPGNGAGSQQIASLKISSGIPTAAWNDGTLATTLNGSAVTQGVTAVYALRKVGNAVTLWQNGVQTASGSTASLGATVVSYAGFGAYFGGGTPALNFNGVIGEQVLVKGTVSDADLITLMRQVAANTPAGPSF